MINRIVLVTGNGEQVDLVLRAIESSRRLAPVGHSRLEEICVTKARLHLGGETLDIAGYSALTEENAASLIEKVAAQLGIELRRQPEPTFLVGQTLVVQAEAKVPCPRGNPNCTQQHYGISADPNAEWRFNFNLVTIE